MVNRIINPIKGNSFFLFGARGTGKTTFLKDHYAGPQTLWIDLLNPELEDLLTRSPNQLLAEIEGFRGDLKWVVIDEVQKCPKLLNLVHQQIEERNLKFALTGSSARRLKQKGVNLLAGRAFTQHLFPFTHKELGEDFSLQDALEVGTLPKLNAIRSEEEKWEYLRSYALNYISYEVQAEQWVRKLEPFRKFLPIAAQMNGKILNYSSIARDVGVDSTTVKSYFEILLDTLVGFELSPFHRSIRKRQILSPKFFFFDMGVKRALEQTLTVPLLPQTSAYGEAFEHFIIAELWRLNSYYKRDFQFSYLRTKDGAEIDLVVERPGRPLALLEIKSKTSVDSKDTTTLRAFKKDLPDTEAFLVSNDLRPKRFEEVTALHWSSIFDELAC